MERGNSKGLPSKREGDSYANKRGGRIIKMPLVEMIPKQPERWTDRLNSLLEQYEWLTDCFRLRFREMSNHQASVIDTQFLFEHILPKFLVFCKLLSEKKLFPSNSWRWDHFLFALNESVRKDFPDSVARAKYEKDFSTARKTGGIHFLRQCANWWYETTIDDCRHGIPSSSRYGKIDNYIHKEAVFKLIRHGDFDGLPDAISGFFQNSALFSDIGGPQVWKMCFVLFSDDVETKTRIGDNETLTRLLDPAIILHSKFQEIFTSYEKVITLKSFDNNNNDGNMKLRNVVTKLRDNFNKSSNAMKIKNDVSLKPTAVAAIKSEKDNKENARADKGTRSDDALNELVADIEGSKATTKTVSGAGSATATAAGKEKKSSTNTKQNKSGNKAIAKAASAVTVTATPSPEHVSTEKVEEDDDIDDMPSLTPLHVVPSASWADGLSSDEQYEWLVDCFRLRYSDVRADLSLQQRLRSSRFRGEEVMPEFLVFCKLAQRRDIIPSKTGTNGEGAWQWDRFLVISAIAIRTEFKENHAKEKYGSEELLSVTSGGRSLRYTANVVFGTSLGESSRSDSMHVTLGNEVRNKKFRSIFSKTSAKKMRKAMDAYFQEREVFNEVGNNELWYKFFVFLRNDAESIGPSLKVSTYLNAHSAKVYEKFHEQKDQDDDKDDDYESNLEGKPEAESKSQPMEDVVEKGIPAVSVETHAYVDGSKENSSTLSTPELKGHHRKPSGDKEDSPTRKVQTAPMYSTTESSIAVVEKAEPMDKEGDLNNVDLIEDVEKTRKKNEKLSKKKGSVDLKEEKVDSLSADVVPAKVASKQPPDDPCAWSYGLSPIEQCNWLADCFRMRFYSSNMYRKAVRDHKKVTDAPFQCFDLVFLEILVFCKFAHSRGVIPASWHWGRFLQVASRTIRTEFKDTHAKEKYGSEDIYAVSSGGRSLRYTADAVYYNSSRDTELELEPVNQMLSAVRGVSEVHALFTVNSFFVKSVDLFLGIGGNLLWWKFFAELGHCEVHLDPCASYSGPELSAVYSRRPFISDQAQLRSMSITEFSVNI